MKTSSALLGIIFCFGIFLFGQFLTADAATTTIEHVIATSHEPDNTTASSFTDILSVLNGEIFVWDPLSYTDIQAIYFEADISHSGGGTTNAELAELGGLSVSNSRVSTTNTTTTKVRSGDIKAFINTTSSINYKAQFRRLTTGTAYVSSTKLIVVQSGLVTSTQQVIYLGSENTITNGTGVWSAVEGGATWVFEPNSYDGTVTAKTRCRVNNVSGNASCRLFDSTSNVAVTSSEVHTGGIETSGDYFQFLNEGHSYIMQEAGSSTSNDITSAHLVLEQSNPTKTLVYLPGANWNIGAQSNTTPVEQIARLRYDAGNWQGQSISYKQVVSLNKSTGDSTFVQLFNATNSLWIATTTINAGGITSSSITMPDGEGNELRTFTETDGGTYNIFHSWVTALVNFTQDVAAATSTGQGLFWWD